MSADRSLGRRLVAAIAAVNLVVAAPASAAATAIGPGEDAAEDAGAGPRIWVAIVPRGAGDPLAETTDEGLREAIAEGLRRAGVELVATAQGRAEVGACEAAACLQPLGESLGVAYLVRPNFTAVDRTYTLHLELFDVRAGAVIGEIDERCALCSLSEARERALGAAKRLAAPLLALPVAPPQLRLTTTPAGARVTVDGVDLGRAPVERPLSAGQHTLRVTHFGHREVTHAIDLVDGQALDVHLVLAPTPKPKPPPEPRLKGWIPLAIGVPTTGVGIALAAIDGSATLGCGSGRDGCNTRVETTWPAAAALVTGAALTTLGAVLIHQARKARRVRANRR